MKIVLILAVYFAVGALGTAYVASRASTEKRRGYWLKYFVYLLLTTSLVTVIIELPKVLPYIVALLAIGGYVELTVGLKPIFARISREEVPLPFLPPRGFSILFPIGFVYSFCAAFLFIFSHQASSGHDPTFLHTYILVVSFDGFSQISGQVVKSRKLMPHISPGKTVAGLVGGIAATILTGAILLYPEASRGVALGTLVAIAAFTGDVLASALKRRLGLKDFSNLIPGHGGILDRFDSMLMAGAVVEVVFYLAPSIR